MSNRKPPRKDILAYRRVPLCMGHVETRRDGSLFAITFFVKETVSGQLLEAMHSHHADSLLLMNCQYI